MNEKLLKRFHAMPMDELDQHIAMAGLARELRGMEDPKIAAANIPKKEKAPRKCGKCGGIDHNARTCKAPPGFKAGE